MTTCVEPATLYIVATPIGNLDDMTFRAVKVLSGVDVVAAEDTRNTARLLSHFSIKNKLVSLHEHNEAARMGRIVEDLLSGTSMALVSDAGTPTVSDPGFLLVRAAVEAGVRVVPVPGASAAVTAMSAAGLPTDSFTFCGFPPKKSGKRTSWFQALADSPRPLIFYVSPHKIVPVLEEMEAVFGDRPGVLCRELTKMHEEILRRPLSEIRHALAERERVRGEITLIVAGVDGTPPAEVCGTPQDLEAAIQKALSEGTKKPAKIAKELALRFGVDRKQVYETISGLRDQEEP